MNIVKTSLAVSLLMVAIGAPLHAQQLPYPETKKVSQTDTYFGTAITDPYRWLENDTSAETGAWVKVENKVTFDYLAKIPFREQIKNRLTKLWDYPKYGVTFKQGNRYFYFKNDGMQNQSVLYVQDSLDAEPTVLLDPNKLSGDGTVSLGEYDFSKDGKYLAYAIARGLRFISSKRRKEILNCFIR